MPILMIGEGRLTKMSARSPVSSGSAVIEPEAPAPYRL